MYFLPFISYLFALEIRYASSKKSICYYHFLRHNAFLGSKIQYQKSITTQKRPDLLYRPLNHFRSPHLIYPYFTYRDMVYNWYILCVSFDALFILSVSFIICCTQIVPRLLLYSFIHSGICNL